MCRFISNTRQWSDNVFFFVSRIMESIVSVPKDKNKGKPNHTDMLNRIREKLEQERQNELRKIDMFGVDPEKFAGELDTPMASAVRASFCNELLDYIGGLEKTQNEAVMLAD